jgi:hypothetical protein
MHTLASTMLTAALWLAPAVAAQAANPWTDAPSAPLPAGGPQPSRYRAVALDLAAVRAQLAAARVNGAAIDLALPLPEGGESTFVLADSGTMPAPLARKYPDIVSLAGADANGRRARVDVSPLGFSAMVFDADGRWVVVPQAGDAARYAVFRGDALPARGPFRCGATGPLRSTLAAATRAAGAPGPVTGTMRRNYRIAVAANSSYVAEAGGGTRPGGLAAVVAAINRVNEVYQAELAIHMTLVANNDLVIYPDPETDPYSNDEDATWQNGPNLDEAIGNAAYDIGHVFTTAGGGLAGLGVTCEEGRKAEGSTGQPHPVGDPFFIDFVAHEIGHQFGGSHTFNGCNNQSFGAEYEPGSGSTIQAYAGICGAENLQATTDPYFHAKSLQQMTDWADGAGGTCAQSQPNANRAPVIDTSGLPVGKAIPALTAFALTGSATDPDGDALTYSWEQYDLGDPSPLGAGDIGNGPIFRSLPAMANPTRYFPRLLTVLGAAFLPGEDMPTTTRDLTFRLTVRDNRLPGGRSASAQVGLSVIGTAGPFAVTLPDMTVLWGRGETRNVGWDAAGTRAAPISCASVDIALSTDGGLTFPNVLATQAPNVGLASVVVPDVPDTGRARVRVQCSTNVFFDISDENFQIAATGTPDPPVDAIFADGFE